MWQNDLKARDYSADKVITGTLDLEVEVRQSHPCNPTVHRDKGSPGACYQREW